MNESLFARATRDKEVAVVEGVMGLFDGFDGASERGSTAEMAKWLGLPVILVIDAQAMARSVAAVVHGFSRFDPDVKVSGIILNRVSGERHYRILSDALKTIPILGWLPPDDSVEIPERHLGLLTAKEATTIARTAHIAEFFAQHIDLDAILSAAASIDSRSPLPAGPRPARTKRLALAHDRAFSFYYRANRMSLEEAGAEIIEFSPLADNALPDAVDLLYLGGGYPELYRQELEANAVMRAALKRYIESGGRFYAECGGLMYLSEAIDGARMVGVVPTRIEMTDRLVDFGYCDVTTHSRSILGKAGTTARGHQFHYSRMQASGGNAYRVSQRGREYSEGFLFPNGIASYIHLHFLSNPAIARNMLES
jgi:cobyrinic acid a,c-diamide synthase